MADRTLDIRAWHMTHRASNIGYLISEFGLIQSSSLRLFSDFRNCCLNYLSSHISYRVPHWDFLVKQNPCKTFVPVFHLVWHCIRFQILFLKWRKIEILQIFAILVSNISPVIFRTMFFLRTFAETLCWEHLFLGFDLALTLSSLSNIIF